MTQDCLVCVDNQTFEVPCLPSKELLVPSPRFEQLHLEIRAVHVDVILATLDRWENEPKGIVARPKESEPISIF